MTFKIFRRGSARCIGLLSAFITILLCLYYISMGQPSSLQPKEPIASLFGSSGSGGAGSSISSAAGQQQANLVSANGGNVLHQQLQQQQQQQQFRIYGSKSRHNNNDDENWGAATAPKQQHQLMLAKTAVNGPFLNPSEDEVNDVNGGSGASMYVSNPQWGDKCYILDESDTNITAQEEYAKFDFQVRQASGGTKTGERNDIRFNNFDKMFVIPYSR